MPSHEAFSKACNSILARVVLELLQRTQEERIRSQRLRTLLELDEPFADEPRSR